MIACLEEIAFENGWIGTFELEESCRRLAASEYGQYLNRLLHHVKSEL